MRPAGCIGIALAVGLLASVASALTIDAASVTVGGRRGDTFRLRGRFSGPSPGDGENVVVTIDRAKVVVPLASFKHRRNTLTYRGVAGPGSLKLVRLDLRKRKFLVTGSGWSVDAFANPFPLAIAGDAGSDCRMVLLAQRGTRGTAVRAGRKSRRQRLRVDTPSSADGGCERLGIVRTRPIVVRAGVPTAVDFSVDLAPGVVVEPGGLHVIRVGSGGDPLCVLAPQAGPAPNRFGCTASISEPSPTMLDVAVEGMAGGAAVLSSGTKLPVVAPLTDDAIATQAAAADGVRQVWNDAAQRLGDTLAARLASIVALPAVPGVLGAELSPNGRDVVLRYDTGWLGLLLLNRPPGDAPAVPAVVSRVVPRPMPRAIFRSCDDGSGAGALCCTPDQRRLLEGREVLIWDPGFFTADRDDAPVIEAKLQEHACLGFQVTKISGAAADVASVQQWVAYSTLILSTHGGVDNLGRVHIATGESALDPAALKRHEALLDLGLIGDAILGYEGERSVVVGSKPHIFTVSEDYLTQQVGGRLPENALVYASFCYSAYGIIPNVFVGAFGAGAYYGFDWSVSQVYTTGTVAPQLFDGLLKHLRTAQKAYDAVSPKVDSHPIDFVVDPVTKKAYLRGLARFVFAGRPEVAYVDAPRLSPENPQLMPGQQATLTVEVDGKGTCDLTHHWHNEAEHGHLSGGDDVEGTSSEMTYSAEASVESGSDGVGAEVLPPDSDEPIGVACDDVTVQATCGDGVRQDTEVCDGDDAPTCPGLCASDCTCGQPPGSVTVEVRNLAAGVGWQIVDVDRDPPRIACPPDCTYSNPQGPHGINQLRVFPGDDPRTGDPPYDVESFEGCAGTTGLPAPGASCFLGSGTQHVIVNLRYRPIVAVEFGGSAVFLPTVSGNPVAPFTGQAVGFACGSAQPQTRSCARHFTVGQGTALQTASNNPPDFPFAAELESWNGPCVGQGIGPGSNLCTFVLTGDTCITATFRTPAGFAGTPHPLSGPTCPTGPAP